MKLSCISLQVGGTLELLIALLHFIWPFHFIIQPEFVDLSDAIKDFIFHATIAIGLTMLIFSYLSFYFSRNVKQGNKNVLMFAYSQLFIWIVRSVFEILLPVQISIYSIDNPSNIIQIGLFFIFIAYLIPVIMLRKRVEV